MNLLPYYRIKSLSHLIILSLLLNSAYGQVNCSVENKTLLKGRLANLCQGDPESLPIGEAMIVIGKRFLTLPYVAKTLEQEGGEQLVVNVSGLDCTTFLENVVVMARLLKQNHCEYEDYIRELEFLRYRQGEMKGYISRLHYFSDWIFQNSEKNILKDITQELGGISYPNTVNFMSTHPQYYPQLADTALLPELRTIEAEVSSRNVHYIPKEKLAKLQSGIQNGDLIAITTSVKGLDIAHVAIAIWVKNKLHLLHATTTSNQVEISPLPLVERLLSKKSQTGIMVCRLVNWQ